jgi:hypothetical protein
MLHHVENPTITGSWGDARNDAERLRFLLQFAVMAPSVRNTQPWQWVVEDDHVDLYADTSRALPEHDPLHRQMVISCGAVLEHLLIAMRHFGYRGRVETLPARHDSDWMARVWLGECTGAEPADHLLFSAIPQRHTNRHIFQPDPLPDELLFRLHEEAANVSCWFHVVESSLQRTQLIDLIAQGEEMQWRDRSVREETIRWMRTNNSESHDGIPGYASGLSNFASQVAPVAARLFDQGEREANRHWLLAGSAPSPACC